LRNSWQAVWNEVI